MFPILEVIIPLVLVGLYLMAHVFVAFILWHVLDAFAQNLNFRQEDTHETMRVLCVFANVVMAGLMILPFIGSLGEKNNFSDAALTTRHDDYLLFSYLNVVWAIPCLVWQSSHAANAILVHHCHDHGSGEHSDVR